MTNQAILEKAVHKAIENGWDNSSLSGDWEEDVNNYKLFIYDHDFAKAIWPAGRCICGETHNRGGIIEIGPGKTTLHELEKDWQYHLQQMVISEDPIQYLGEHI